MTGSRDHRREMHPGEARQWRGRQLGRISTLPRIGNKPYRLAMSDGAARGTKRLRAVQIAVALLLLIVILSVVKRFVIDMPNLAAGTLPEDEFDHRYVEQAWLAYLHIMPGALYLFLAPLQLAYRFRSRHYTFHRRLGRVLAGAGMISGVFALIFGSLFSFGGLPEAIGRGGVRPVVPDVPGACGPGHPSRRHRASPSLDDPSIRHRHRHRHHPDLARALPDSRAGGRIELRSGILDLVQPACVGRRTVATGLSESSRVCPRVAGLYLEPRRAAAGEPAV